MAEYEGLACIGDPHLASRIPGFRKDDYPSTMLGKLRWCVAYAREQHLLPVLLGDLFNWPRDNANWLLVELISMFGGEVVGIAGNHDCGEDTLSPDDTLSILEASGRVRLLSPERCWRGTIGGVPVLIGGTPWGCRLPETWERGDAGLVLWLAHHDIGFEGYEAARLRPRELPGIDIVINGHIHRPLPEVRAGTTTWLNPGNVARVSRGDASRQRRPSLLRIDVQPDRTWRASSVEVPHLPFDDVFYAEVAESAAAQDAHSTFVRGLSELEAQRTASGVGLHAFLRQNLGAFEPEVAEEIRRLAREVIADDDG